MARADLAAASTRPLPGRRSDYAWFDLVTTRWSDNDSYGHVNNAIYYAWIDTAVNRLLLESRPFNLGGPPARGLVAESGCRYFSSAAYPDVIHVGARVGHIGSTSVRYEFGLFRNHEQQASAEGFFVHVYIGDRDRPSPLPSWLRSLVEDLCVSRNAAHSTGNAEAATCL
jgi:acyl-CoA thioester hydrolase